LPARWQEALWYSEVEGMQPARIAPLLGLSAQATAALCYRAREGLRQAWIRAHLTSPDLGPECSWTVDRLGAHARGRLGQRERTRVDAHLDTCAKCTLVAAEAKDVGDRLALILLPLAIGAAGATAYLATLHAGTVGVTAGAVIGGGATGTTASGAAGSTASGVASGSSGTAAGASAGSTSTSGGIFSGTTGIIVGAVAAVVVVGAAVAGIALATAASAHGGTTASTVDSASSSDNSATKQDAPDPAPSPAPSPSAAAPRPAPAPAPVAAQPAARAASTEPDAPTAPSSPSSPTAPSPPSNPGTPTNPGTPGDPGTPPTTHPQPPAAPAITTVDTGGGRYFPLVSGTAQAGATVKVTGAGSSVTTQAGADGSWTISTAFTGYGVGNGTVSATQTDASTDLESAAATASFTLSAPQASVAGVIRPGGLWVNVTTTGAAGAGYELILDERSLGTSTLGGSGTGTRYRLVWPAGAHTIDARYSDGAGRVGPSSQTSFTVRL
jgi:hypothetical protein